ncbi:MAG: MerR family transcriptional regulator [Deltaproteobacteria bacterium]|nr:MAG: MerR family transcriptional regulator [Deltaproteobacteria bacterium]
MRPTGPDIPDKRYFRIGEVSAITGIEPYVLRYWETEFPKINPARSRSGQRLYKRCDIETILEIKDLLYRKRYTIAGAKQYLQRRPKNRGLSANDTHPLTLDEIRAELLAIRDLLNR